MTPAAKNGEPSGDFYILRRAVYTTQPILHDIMYYVAREEAGVSQKKIKPNKKQKKMCMCVYIYIYMHVCTHVQTHTHTHRQADMHTVAHTPACTSHTHTHRVQSQMLRSNLFSLSPTERCL